VALGPQGQNIYYFNQDTPEEAARRALESCGSVAGVPCMVVALDDVFVVPVPTTLKVIGFFLPASNSAIASDARSDAAHQLHAVTGGWNAVAVGANGRPGPALKASTSRTPSILRWEIAPSRTAIATSSPSARFWSDQIS
jgi:adenylate cyclase